MLVFLVLLKSGLETSITENIYRHKPVLESIFRAIDKDHSGQISKEEFRNVCGLINQHDPTAKLSHDVIEDLANTMDIDKDGLINFNEVSILNNILCYYRAIAILSKVLLRYRLRVRVFF